MVATTMMATIMPRDTNVGISGDPFDVLAAVDEWHLVLVRGVQGVQGVQDELHTDEGSWCRGSGDLVPARV